MKFFSPLLKKNMIYIMIDSFTKLPIPSNINLWWNFGSILGLFFMIQVISGFLLSMYYCPNINYAYESVIYIMKEVNNGWMIRAAHLNGASFYFLFMFIHIGRNIYYNSFKSVGTWSVGILILLVSMLTAFLGYVLPWGQMSMWGAIVITSLLTSVPYFGESFVEWIWGGFTVGNATLNRFFAMHFLFPFFILILIIIHLVFLHYNGSNNPLGIISKKYMIPFHPYYTLKDVMGYLLILFIFFYMILQYPWYLGDPDNFHSASCMVTPIHIKPEWYFLFAYSILRSIPSKLGGVIMLLMSILILYFMPFYNYKVKTMKFYPINKLMFYFFIQNFIILTWLGGQILDYPYYYINNIFSVTYFMYFIFTPLMNMWWDYILK